MTYRHHSLRCHHRVQNTQGSNEHQLRITCQECHGHLAIIYGKHLNPESRQTLQTYLYATTSQVPKVPAPPWPGREAAWVTPPSQWRERRPQPRARAAAAMPGSYCEPCEPRNGPKPVVRELTSKENLEAEIKECQAMAAAAALRLSKDLSALPRVETPPSESPPPSPPAFDPEEWDQWELPVEMPTAQGSPRQQRPPP